MKRLVIVMLCAVMLLSNLSLISYAKKKNQYVYYDMLSWRRYISDEEPNCRHDDIGYRFVESDYHSVYCRNCGVIFGYESCYIDNSYYTSPSDYWHDRCQICLNKKEYVYEGYKTVYRNYID